MKRPSFSNIIKCLELARQSANALSSSSKGIFSMLKYYVKATETLKNLRQDTAGVVSFEYVIVAACVVAAVALAFGTTTSSGIGKVLSDAITAIGSKVTSA